jgi:hypothetical protein
MASAKFSAFEFASEEFNSDLAKLVNGFTQSLVKLITEECARNENKGEDSENGSNQSSPFSSPTGKAPRKKAAPKRGRPSKEDTDVVIDNVDDVRNVSDDLLSRVEMVRSSSKSPRNTVEDDNSESMAVSLDDLMVQPEQVPEETTTAKKGKAKVSKEPKEKKEKVVKEPKAPKEPKEKKEKVVKEPKVPKEPKEKKEKVAKEPKGKKGKKGDEPALHEEPIQQFTSPPAAALDEDDNDGLDEELVNSQSVDLDSFEKLTSMVQGMKIGGDELVEETDYANIGQTIDGIIDTLERVITSARNSQEDDIVVDDDMDHSPPEDESGDEDEEDEDGDGDEL